MTYYTLKVINIIKETDDTITLCLKQPALRKIKYLAGQYLTLIFRINGRRYIRPYSFSSSPLVDASLNITIKRVVGGIVSNHIHDVVKEGDSVEVMSPLGNFVLTEKTLSQHFFFWGAGSGITPLISLIKELLASTLSSNVVLVYGNKSYEQTIFANELDRLQDKYNERLKVFHFHTKMSILNESPFIFNARITKEWIFKLLEPIHKSASTHYICGPLGLKESVKDSLSRLEIPDEQIFSEDFELVKNPIDFVDINTQNITLSFEREIYSLEVIKGKSILESALDANIELPYSCQTGNCNTCMGKLLTGNVKMIGLSKERNDLKSNEYLLCCTYPTTGDVLIEI